MENQPENPTLKYYPKSGDSIIATTPDGIEHQVTMIDIVGYNTQGKTPRYTVFVKDALGQQYTIEDAHVRYNPPRQEAA